MDFQSDVQSWGVEVRKSCDIMLLEDKWHRAPLSRGQTFMYPAASSPDRNSGFVMECWLSVDYEKALFLYRKTLVVNACLKKFCVFLPGGSHLMHHRWEEKPTVLLLDYWPIYIQQYRRERIK